MFESSTRSLGGVEKSELRDDPTGIFHLFPILITVLRDEHLFFLWHPEEVQQSPCDNAEHQDERVCEHEPLGDNQDPEMGVHRVADLCVNPCLHEAVPFFYREDCRPVLPEITMRNDKQSDVEREDDENDEPNRIRNRECERIEVWGEDREQGQESHTDEVQCNEERLKTGTDFLPHFALQRFLPVIPSY